MRVTVGICTWNRADLLHKTLQQIRQLEIPHGVDWSVLVVNNRCTDHTDDVLARHDARLPLRRLYESTPGKSHALNSAVAAIEDDLILWTDDDVLVDTHWLSQHVSAAKAMPEVSFFGGTIEPWFEVTPPDWISDNWSQLSSVFATRDLGGRSFPIDETCLPYGANFAIRTQVQKAFLYDARLGRVGPSEVRGEETELVLNMLEQGYRGHWWPAAKVRHFIPRERLTEDYLRRFYFGIGQTNALMGNQPPPRGWKRPLLWKRATVDELKYRLRRHYSSSDRWLKHMIRSSLTWGRLAGQPQTK